MNYDDLSKEALVEILHRRDAQAHYGLHWERHAIERDRALNRDFVGLELDPDLCVGAGPWENMVIEGDNYDALRHLATTHASAFHLVYIDVPYNTGNRDFVYNDNFFDARNRYRHSTWLEFMYQRLTLARTLLREDGAIVVSIDDNELFNLGLLMHQVFGERKFIANCIWQKRYSRENREAIGDAHEYLLIYSPNPDAFKRRRGRIPLSDEQARVYRNPENPRETDPTRRWRGIPMTAQGYRANQMYRIVSPNGTPHDPPEGRCWSMVESEFEALKAQNRIYWGRDGTAQPSVIRFLSEVDGLVPWTWWPHEEVGHTDEARKEIQDIFGTQTAFDTPKPLRLMERVLQICAPERDALVLDFFAGSGTTAHAVLKLNRQDNGNRKWVMVSSRESTPENPDKNLARDVCRRRLQAAVEGYHSARFDNEVEGLGGNFAYLRATTVPMHRLEEGLSDDMVWSFALLACGHPLTLRTSALSVSVKGAQLVAYCADSRAGTLAALSERLSAHSGPAVILSWAPQAIASLPMANRPTVSIVSVPSDLRRAFKQGNAGERNEELLDPEAADTTEEAE